MPVNGWDRACVVTYIRSGGSSLLEESRVSTRKHDAFPFSDWFSELSKPIILRLGDSSTWSTYKYSTGVVRYTNACIYMTSDQWRECCRDNDSGYCILDRKTSKRSAAGINNQEMPELITKKEEKKRGMYGARRIINRVSGWLVRLHYRRQNQFKACVKLSESDHQRDLLSKRHPEWRM